MQAFCPSVARHRTMSKAIARHMGSVSVWQEEGLGVVNRKTTPQLARPLAPTLGVSPPSTPKSARLMFGKLKLKKFGNRAE